MNYSLIKMKIKPGQTDQVVKFLVNLLAKNREEMIKNAKNSGLLLDGYFVDDEFLYVFKKQLSGEAHLHLSTQELANNMLLKSILDFTDQHIDSTTLIEPVMTIDTEGENETA